MFLEPGLLAELISVEDMENVLALARLLRKHSPVGWPLGGATFVAMMKAAYFRECNDSANFLRLNGAGNRRILE